VNSNVRAGSSPLCAKNFGALTASGFFFIGIFFCRLVRESKNKKLLVRQIKVNLNGIQFCTPLNWFLKRMFQH
jgi:hypothetical protein